jgi:hypothetical protein
MELDRILGPPGQAARSPFARWTTLTSFQNKKIPDNLPTYDGTTDPRDFLQTFVNNMVTRDFNEYEICKVVLSFLREKAQNWFSNTKPESLFSYRCFVRYLLSSFFQKKKFTMLMNDVTEQGKQNLGEKTQTHYHHFVDLYMNCIDRTDAIIIHAYTQSITDQIL